jgi:hypothetical protein
MNLVEVKTGDQWPPKADEERLAKYDKYRRFFRGQHQDAFRYLGAKCEDDSGLQRKIYIVCNYAGLMSRKCADFLVGEPPTFLVSGPKGPNVELQSNLDRLARVNKLQPMLYKTECAASYRGDGIFRVRDNGRHTVLDQVAAPSYFVRTDPDDCNEIEAEAVAWIRQGQNGKYYLRVEHHVPGWIYQEAFLCGKPECGKITVGEAVKLKELYDRPPSEKQRTKVETSLLFHCPNFEVDDEFWGVSDYDDLASIFEAINNRLSKIDAYLDKHSKPKLVGFEGMAGPDGNVDSEQDYFQPTDLELAKALPRYVTWEGQMIAAFREIEQLEDELFRLSEMAPAMFGLDKAGSIESARAMKLRFVNPRAKLNRKRALMDPPLKHAIETALLLDKMRYKGPDPEGYNCDIRWQDGIPEDYRENIDAEAQRITSGTSSKASAIQRIDRVTPQQAQEELDRIEAEKRADQAGVVPMAGSAQPTSGPETTAGQVAGEGSQDARRGDAGNQGDGAGTAAL